MPTTPIPLQEILTNAAQLLGLSALPTDEAVQRIQDLYSFLSTRVEAEIHKAEIHKAEIHKVEIYNGIATITLITLPEEQGRPKPSPAPPSLSAIALYCKEPAVLPAHTGWHRSRVADLAWPPCPVNLSPKSRYGTCDGRLYPP